MKIIKEMIEHMRDTLDEADEYAKEARLIKGEYPTVAALYVQLGEEHLDIYSKMHSQVVSLINDYKRNSGDAPETMKIVWDYEHERMIECYDSIRISLNKAKTM